MGGSLVGGYVMGLTIARSNWVRGSVNRQKDPGSQIARSNWVRGSVNGQKDPGNRGQNTIM
ncbi:hypothetical protein Pst134EA_030312 [Puccinia striiformis f. sp. tritici]|uniref:hypothetical protein n=1 Tax=Puccinia striiformis f. sp. tritici TaxID=168172 RepID=UPI0020086DEA|nr:hypothetical protein Pst134EA_030312 [Puccinia striiformis f. sp. tritici]KAH9440233.1 hypothetical protein Pst134EB_030858 [Puccinia striiformis f. sp. tritici]KAH9446392.1 hypothetical protein Pst134EA_030312 [Puccinia striiformis f. sp. tritici]